MAAGYRPQPTTIAKDSFTQLKNQVGRSGRSSPGSRGRPSPRSPGRAPASPPAAAPRPHATKMCPRPHTADTARHESRTGWDTQAAAAPEAAAGRAPAAPAAPRQQPPDPKTFKSLTRSYCRVALTPEAGQKECSRRRGPYEAAAHIPETCETEGERTRTIAAFTRGPVHAP